MSRHRSPVVDKALLLIEELAGTESGPAGGLSLNDLTERLKVPRSTVYRTLNSLLAGRFVVKAEGGPLYRLGPRIGELAGLGPAEIDRARLVAAATPVMERLVARLGEACKLSVADGDEALTIHAIASPADYGLSVRVGRRAPLYAGGAGKALLAFASAAEQSRVAAGPLVAYTSYTISSPDTLREALEQVRRQGYAEDNAELTPGIRSLAAPILAASGGVVGALSVPYLGDPTPDRIRTIRQAVRDSAEEIGRAVGAARHLVSQME